jgi:hypothetical protein
VLDPANYSSLVPNDMFSPVILWVFSSACQPAARRRSRLALTSDAPICLGSVSLGMTLPDKALPKAEPVLALG